MDLRFISDTDLLKQAGRRIQAMRLLMELPQIEEKVASGALSLSNISQAQSFFREMRQGNKGRDVHKRTKEKILRQLENKSARDGKRELLKINPKAAAPVERERQVTDELSVVNITLDKELKARLKKVRSLLGPKGVGMGYGELLKVMSGIVVDELERKKFGKQRVAKEKEQPQKTPTKKPAQVSSNARYISQELKHKIWRRDGGRCGNCGTLENLQVDHIKPASLGGKTITANLRLLCFQCNQRAAMWVMGVEFVRQKQMRQKQRASSVTSVLSS